MANTSFPAPPAGLLDAAATPLAPAAAAALASAWERGWADPRRLHRHGRQAARLLDEARAQLAEGLGVRPDEVTFTPGGPAALRLAQEGLRYAGRRRGARLVASAVEHSAILTSGRHVAAMAGTPELIAEVPVDRWGRVDVDAWASAVAAPGAAFAALQSANGEVGTRQPLPEAREICRRHGIPLLVDATASLGRDPVPTDFDVLAGDARSWGGPPGLGVLVVRTGVRWRRDAPPSELEHGRSDIEPVIPLAVSAAAAWAETSTGRAADAAAARDLVARIRSAASTIPETEVAGDPEDRLPHIVTFSALLADGEALVTELDRRGYAVSSGSACTSSTLEPSHVLAAMGVLTHGNVRVTLPLATVAPDRESTVTGFCAVLPDAIAAVRAQLGSR
ncbi:MAG TPA: aminotransferase class V-fold PLP-dependent enzyme [Dermatophilaceae bacterium]|nr:aminotransferase class V-fold PLP-dependent enzyme [Dermatophilaceae bacterium]HMT88975.1 aminotransferase class V-fold PLP-dependent enzyme [Dermatophilaceae bacterium]